MADEKKTASYRYRLWYYLAATFIPVILFLFSISLLIKNLNGQIDFASDELMGIRAVEAIHDGIVDLQNIRGITSIGLTPGKLFSGKDIESLQKDFLQKLNHVAVSPGMFIDATKELLPLKKKAEALFAAAPGPQSFNEYTFLIREMRSLIQVVANRSSMILDPVTDTYYLAELAVHHFPQIIEYVGRVRGVGGMLLTTRDPEIATDLRVQMAALENEEREAGIDVQTILQSAPHLKSSLEPVIGNARSMLAGFVETGRSIGADEHNGMTPLQYFEQGTRVIGAYLKAYHQVSDLFEARLMERHDHLKRLRLLSISGAFLSIVLMVYFIRSFYQKNQQVFEKIEELSVTDTLTGLYNRRHFYEIISRELQRFHRDGKSFALAILDIDHFKQYNDEYGHQAGDEVLRQVARSMSGNLQRAGDFLFRLGGEEFCFFFGGVTLEQARAGAESVRSGIESLNIPHRMSSAGPSLTASIGMAYLPQVGSQDYSNTMKKADEALYVAKAQGRNRCSVVVVVDEKKLKSTGLEIYS